MFEENLGIFSISFTFALCSTLLQVFKDTITGTYLLIMKIKVENKFVQYSSVEQKYEASVVGNTLRPKVGCINDFLQKQQMGKRY